MSHCDFSRPRVLAKPLLMATLGSMVVACSQNWQKSASVISEDQACTSLKSVLAQASAGFNAFRGSSTTDYDHTRWDAQPIISGTQCDVIAWGGVRTNYACTWNKGNEASARTRLSRRARHRPTVSGPGMASFPSRRTNRPSHTVLES